MAKNEATKAAKPGDTVLHTGIRFNKTKETKNTVKFDEVPAPGKPAIIGSLYIQKWTEPPATVYVDIRF